MNMKKGPENNGTEEGLSLEQFRAEIAAFAAREISGEEESGHFLAAGIPGRESKPEFDTARLTDEDRDIWQKIKDGTIGLDEFHAYARGVSALDNNDPAKPSRVVFSEFAGNMSMRAIFENSGVQKKEK